MLGAPMDNTSFCAHLARENESIDAEAPKGQEWIGISFAVLSTLLTTLALMWVKRSTIVEQGLPLFPCRCFGGSCGKPWKKIFVLAQTFNLLSGAFFSTVAYVFAPLSLISPIGGASLIFSGLIARSGIVPGIKEHLSAQDWAALVFVLISMVGTSLFGPKSSSVMPFDEWQDQWARPAVPVHFSVSMGGSLVWLLLVSKCTRYNPWVEGSTIYILMSTLTSSAIGAWAVLFTKVWSTALSILFAGDARAVGQWLTWLGVVGFAICGPAQLYLMNKALTGGRASFGVPLYFIVIINLTILLDGLYFRVFECMPDYDVTVFVGCLACVIGGTAVMAYQQERRKALVGDSPVPPKLAVVAERSEQRCGACDEAARGSEIRSGQISPHPPV